MKKALISITALAVVLTGCNTMKQKQQEPMIGMANPASEFCIKQGGSLEPKKSADGGAYALCHLPDGQVVEEWEYFRKHHQPKPHQK